LRYRQLGRTGVQVSRFSLGASFFGTRIGRDDSARILRRALELGVNVVDTAESYLRPAPLASEAVLGEILPEVRRDVFLATKVGPARTWEAAPANRGLSRRVVVQAVEGSLARLRTDHVDLLYAHFPDPATPLEETLGAIEDLIRAGKVRYAGLSNHSAARVAEALWTADRRGWRPIVATQDLYNLFERVNEHDLYPLCERHGVGAFAYAPLAGGLLTGKYSLGMARDATTIPGEARAAYYGRAGSDAAPARSSPRLTEPTVLAAQRVAAWAEARQHRPAHVALAWVAGHPAVTSTLLGVTTLEQLEENVPALDLDLTPAERDDIADLLPRELVNRVQPTW
jgi:aryl-alcohol dehydrogenase (NADP+)